MNDYHLDPPDYPEPPDCCGDMMDVDDSGVCICLTCGKRIEPEPDPPDPVGMEHADIPHGCRECGAPTECIYCEKCAETVKCPHGNRFGDCDHCDHLADLAYDAARESR